MQGLGKLKRYGRTEIQTGKKKKNVINMTAPVTDPNDRLVIGTSLVGRFSFIEMVALIVLRSHLGGLRSSVLSSYERPNPLGTLVPSVFLWH